VSDDCLIRLKNVSASLGSSVIVRDLNLCVRRGEVTALVGGSGSGKTTVLRLMLRLGQPTKGTVYAFGRPLQSYGDGKPALELSRVGVLFQQGALFSALSVFDNVALPLRELKTLPEDMIGALVMRKLQLVEIDAASAGKMPAELSGGMVKRVALARALAHNPELLFLDEPTAGLDPGRAHAFVRLIDSLRRELHLTVVMATHDVDTLIALADRVGVLADQRLVAVGPLWDVAEHPHPFVQHFFLGHRQRCEKQAIRDFRDRLAQAPAAHVGD